MGEFGFINASRFIQNNASSVGGAIASNSSLLIVQSTDFTNNTAEYGGAIFNINYLFVANSEFTGNTAEVANAIAVADGTLLLLNNTINTKAADVVVGDEGVIGSYVNVTILDNSTLDVVEDTYIIYAKITDDMGNLIEAEGFEFVINDEETVPATYNATTGLYQYVFEIPDEPAVYYVNMTYIETEMLDTHIGILRYIRGTYTDLQNRILDTEENGTLELPYNFAYTESIDGMAFQFGVIIFQPINIEGNDYVISGSDSYRIFLIGANNVNITDVVFANGNATDDESLGGAILVAGDAENVTIADSLFVNNTAAYGGAIFFVGENGVVDGVWFINNTAENKGGAIYWKGNYGNISGIFMDDVSLPTEMTLFINNTAGEKGGAIHVVGNNFTIENSGFMGNNATDGGAVSVVGSDVSIDHNMFIYNNAADGGAVYITEDAEGIIIDDSLFYANNATEHGGAIYSEGVDLVVYKTHFYQNGALYGGAITTFNRTAN
jgi:predicted outer membrane repeat protein